MSAEELNDFFELLFNEKTLIIAVLALIVSLFSLFENIRARKKNTMNEQIKQQLDLCNEALNLLVFDGTKMDKGTKSFNKIFALNQIIGKNLLCLEEQELSKFEQEFQKINDDYERVSMQRLGKFNLDLESSIALYDKKDFPDELDNLYKKVLKITRRKRKELIDKLK